MPDTANQVPTDKDKAKGGALQGWSGWNPFDTLQREIDRIFDDFGRSWGMPAPRRRFQGRGSRGGSDQWMMPAVDVAEQDGTYEITAELPGLNENDIELSIANGVLTIRGEKSEQTEDERKDYRLSERRYGSFQRTFTLPNDADPDKITATFKNGLLTVMLPKHPGAHAQTKRIAIKPA
jgi:HSP20 family protein